MFNFYLRNFLGRLGSDSEDLRGLKVVVDKGKADLIRSFEKYQMPKSHYILMGSMSKAKLQVSEICCKTNLKF
jgi:hypothetical protein